MKVLGIILARGGSTRIPEKNLQCVGGIPLVQFAAMAARDAQLTSIVVSTDDARIAEVCEPFGVKWIRRPNEISGPESTIEEAVQHALVKAEKNDGCQYDYCVVLQAAVPIRPNGSIRALLDCVIDGNLRGGITCVKRSAWMWQANQTFDSFGNARTWWNPRKGYPRSQDVQHSTLEEVNAIQITPRAEALACKRWSSPMLLLELPKWADHDIDNPEDLEELRNDWPTISHRMHKQEFPWHLMVHPDVPKVQFPPVKNQFKDHYIGVVLGNGPQIDTLPQEFFNRLRSPYFLSVGVNRICASQNCYRYGFAPDIHMIWDSGQRGNALTEAQIEGLKKLEGCSWRMISHEPYARCYPHDQVLAQEADFNGEPRGVKMVNTTTDGAVNMLYRLGVREVYLYGVEMNNSAHCKVFDQKQCAFVDESKFEAPWVRPGQMEAGLQTWRDIQKELPDLKLYCACKDSMLVKEGVCEFREIDIAPKYE